MNKKNLLLASAIASVLALGGCGEAKKKDEVKKPAEKGYCYGSNKAGENDCKGGGTSCPGQQKEDYNKDYFKKKTKEQCKKDLEALGKKLDWSPTELNR